VRSLRQRSAAAGAARASLCKPLRISGTTASNSPCNRATEARDRYSDAVITLMLLLTASASFSKHAAACEFLNAIYTDTATLVRCTLPVVWLAGHYILATAVYTCRHNMSSTSCSSTSCSSAACHNNTSSSSCCSSSRSNSSIWYQRCCSNAKYSSTTCNSGTPT
jgi:hypothetical protein